jgi:hypothetical protein
VSTGAPVWFGSVIIIIIIALFAGRPVQVVNDIGIVKIYIKHEHGFIFQIVN